MPAQLVDSHCHLEFKEYAREVADVINRAHEAGVGTLLTIGTKVSENESLLAIAREYEHVYAALGIHPHEVESEPKLTVEEIMTMVDHPKVIGIGETGLDFYYEHSPRKLQEESFRRHIAAARQTGLPLIVHTRSADAETVKILHDEYAKGPFKGLIHCYSTDWSVAAGALEIGFYISASGIITFKKSDALRENFKKVPLDRLLVETDSPFLAPEPFRGKVNEPAHVVVVAKALAILKGVSYETLSRPNNREF